MLWGDTYTGGKAKLEVDAEASGVGEEMGNLHRHRTSKAALLQLQGVHESPGSWRGAGSAVFPAKPQVRLMLVRDQAENQGSELLVTFNFSARVEVNGCAFSLN